MLKSKQTSEAFLQQSEAKKWGSATSPSGCLVVVVGNVQGVGHGIANEDDQRDDLLREAAGFRDSSQRNMVSFFDQRWKYCVGLKQTPMKTVVAITIQILAKWEL